LQRAPTILDDTKGWRDDDAVMVVFCMVSEAFKEKSRLCLEGRGGEEEGQVAVG